MVAGGRISTPCSDWRFFIRVELFIIILFYYKICVNLLWSASQNWINGEIKYGTQFETNLLIASGCQPEVDSLRPPITC